MVLRLRLRLCVLLGVAVCLLAPRAEGSAQLMGFARPHADAHLELDGVHERARDLHSDSSDEGPIDEARRAKKFHEAIQRTPSASVLKSFWEDFSKQNFDGDHPLDEDDQMQGGGAGAGGEAHGGGAGEVYYDELTVDYGPDKGCLPKGLGDMVGGIKNCLSGEAHIYEIGADGQVARVRSPMPVERKRPEPEPERREPASTRAAWFVARTLSPMDIVRSLSGALRFTRRSKESALASADRMDTEALLRATTEQMASLRNILVQSPPPLVSGHSILGAAA